MSSIPSMCYIFIAPMARYYCRLVIATLKDIPAERRCFRMVGGVLMERTVKEVLPIMQNNYTMVGIYVLYSLRIQYILHLFYIL